MSLTTFRWGRPRASTDASLHGQPERARPLVQPGAPRSDEARRAPALLRSRHGGVAQDRGAACTHVRQLVRLLHEGVRREEVPRDAPDHHERSRARVMLAHCGGRQSVREHAVVCTLLAQVLFSCKCFVCVSYWVRCPLLSTQHFIHHVREHGRSIQGSALARIAVPGFGRCSGR